MKKSSSKSLVDIVEAAGTMILFMLFAVSMMIIIAAGASSYTKISTAYEKTFSTSAPLKYIANKIRSAETVEILSDGKAFAIKNGRLQCVIFNTENGISELNISADETPIAEGGTCIFENTAFDITEDDMLYNIECFYNNDNSVLVVRKG